jgi:hypothetical protein
VKRRFLPSNFPDNLRGNLIRVGCYINHPAQFRSVYRRAARPGKWPRSDKSPDLDLPPHLRPDGSTLFLNGCPLRREEILPMDLKYGNQK